MHQWDLEQSNLFWCFAEQCKSSVLMRVEICEKEGEQEELDDFADFGDQNRTRVHSRCPVFRGESHQPVDHTSVQGKSNGHWKCYMQW